MYHWFRECKNFKAKGKHAELIKYDVGMVYWHLESQDTCVAEMTGPLLHVMFVDSWKSEKNSIMCNMWRELKKSGKVSGMLLYLLMSGLLQ